MLKLRSTSKLVLLAVVLGSILDSGFTFAKPELKIRTYDNAMELYKRRYYNDAMAILDQLIPAERSPERKAGQLKLKAILHYMLNDQQKASQTFQQALQFDSSVVVTNKDVFHPAIVKFFSEERRRQKGVQVGQETIGTPPLYHLNRPMKSDQFISQQESLEQSLPPGSATLQMPYDPIAAMGATPKEMEATQNPMQPYDKKNNPTLSSINKEVAKPQTTISILSNVKEAQVYIDGILAGGVNTPLQVSPGIIDVEVNAPGFTPQTKRLAVDKDKQSSVTIFLSKSVKKKNKALAAKPLKKLKPRGVVGQAAIRPNPNLDPKREALSLFDEEPTSATKPTQDLTSEFEKDASLGAGPKTAGSTSPAGIFGATGFGQGIPQVQGGYVFPGQGSNAPIIVINVPPAGAAAAPTPYSSPSPTPPSPYQAAPITPPGAAALPPGVPAAVPPPPPSAPGASGPGLGARSGSSRSSSKNYYVKREPRSHILRLLPLGIPQYYLGQPILGTLFAGGQIAGAYLFWDRTQQSNTITKTANATISQRNLDQEKLGTDEEKAAWEADTNTYQTKQQDLVNQTRQEASIGMILAGGLWAVSVITAYIYDPEATAIPKRSKVAFNVLPSGAIDLRLSILDSMPVLLPRLTSSSDTWRHLDHFDLHFQLHPLAHRQVQGSALLAFGWNL